MRFVNSCLKVRRGIQNSIDVNRVCQVHVAHGSVVATKRGQTRWRRYEPESPRPCQVVSSPTSRPRSLFRRLPAVVRAPLCGLFEVQAAFLLWKTEKL